MNVTRDLERRTTAHYEAYPFDFMTPEDESAIEAMQPAPFRKFVADHIFPGCQVAEIGCGPGRGTMYLAEKGAEVAAVDISRQSLELARRRASEARFICASNLALPFAASRFDAVVSDGVVHHTPDAKASFLENARLLRPGGHYYLGVYKRGGHYDYIYNYLGPPIRWLEKSALGRMLVYATVFPIYYLAHLIKSRGKRTLKGALNFFYDYLITPRASFHSFEEVASWGKDAGLDLLAYDRSLGNVHVFIFRRP